MIEQLIQVIWYYVLNNIVIPEHLVSWAATIWEVICDMADTNLVLFEDGSHRQQ